MDGEGFLWRILSKPWCQLSGVFWVGSWRSYINKWSCGWAFIPAMGHTHLFCKVFAHKFNWSNVCGPGLLENSWGLIWSKTYHADSLYLQTAGIPASPVYGKSVFRNINHMTSLFTRPGYRKFPLHLRTIYMHRSPKIKNSIN